MMGLLIIFPKDEEDRVTFRLGAVSSLFFFLRLTRMQATATAKTTAATAPATTPPITAADGPLVGWLLSSFPDSPAASPEVGVGSAVLVTAEEVVSIGLAIELEVALGLSVVVEEGSGFRF
jgi:hypothetical protein